MSGYADVSPKETLYNGVWYDSKLEAQWAVFFKAANIDYVSKPGLYPKEGGGGYRPDFYLPQFDLFVEVKRNTESGIQEIYDRCIKAIHWGGDIKQILILSNVPVGHSLDGGLWHFPIIYWCATEIRWGWWYFYDDWEDRRVYINGKMSSSPYPKPPIRFRNKQESISAFSDMDLKNNWPWKYIKYLKEQYQEDDGDNLTLDDHIHLQESSNEFTFKAFRKANKAWFKDGKMPNTKTVFEEKENYDD